MYEIYVDGTYNRDQEKAGYGFIVFKDNDLIHVQKGRVRDYLESWQIAAELIGAIKVFEWCHGNGVKKFKLYYDYQGIEDFATGGKVARAEVSKHYEQTYAMYRSYGIHPLFDKVDRKHNLAHQIASDGIFEDEDVVLPVPDKNLETED